MYGILTHLEKLSASYKNTFAVLSSFTQVTLMCTEDLKTKVDIANVTLESEPSFLGLGPQNLATGFNNFAYIYRYVSHDGNYSNPPILESKQDYLSAIKEVKLNAGYAAILTEKHVFL